MLACEHTTFIEDAHASGHLREHLKTCRWADRDSRCVVRFGLADHVRGDDARRTKPICHLKRVVLAHYLVVMAGIDADHDHRANRIHEPFEITKIGLE